MVHIHLDLCSVMLLFIMDQPQTRYWLKERSFVLVGSGRRLHGIQIEFASAGSVLVHVWLCYFP